MAKMMIVHARLSPEEKHAKLWASLEDHRHLIERAVKAMTEGDLVPALTIATSLRVLIHESGMSKPLLKSLKSNYLDLIIKDDLPPVDHGPPTPNAIKIASFNLPISVRFSTKEPKIALKAAVENEVSVPTSLGMWWTKPFMNLPRVGSYSRRQLVLDVANKEGAHVDVEVSEQYQRLLDSEFLKFQNDDGQSAAVNISRLMVGKAGVQMLGYLEDNFPSR